MRLKVCMIKSLCNFHDETVISNTQSVAKRSFQLFCPSSKF